MILDLRCPACNWPVIGHDEVVIVEKIPDLPGNCPKCHTKITLMTVTEHRPSPSTHYAFTKS